VSHTAWAIELQKRFIFRSIHVQLKPWDIRIGDTHQKWEVTVECRSCHKMFITTDVKKSEAHRILKNEIKNHTCKK
jgi:hypothetical protein